MRKKNKSEPEFDLDTDLAPAPAKGNDLMLVPRDGAPLSAAQAEFNKLMKRLENTRAKERREKDRLDQLVKICATEIMPLVDQLHRLNFQMVMLVIQALKTLKLSGRRREHLGNLVHERAAMLVEDSCGLTEDEVEKVRLIVEELTAARPEHAQASKTGEFDFARDMIESVMRNAGFDVDFSDLDMHSDPAEFERQVKERLDAATADIAGRAQGRGRGGRKPTKAKMEREKKLQEAEEAKKRDLKSLYKQLAKVLHPDLEADPARKLQKEEWMKRLTTAHASGDLRELLCIEMEWLGVEASNLTSASDEKLKIYCTVLKEQIAEMKERTSNLMFAPEYAFLDRFRNPFTGHIPPAFYIKQDLTDDLARHEEMVHVLQAGGEPCRQMLHSWADDRARDEAAKRRIFG